MLISVTRTFQESNLYASFSINPTASCDNVDYSGHTSKECLIENKRAHKDYIYNCLPGDAINFVNKLLLLFCMSTFVIMIDYRETKILF